MRATSSAYRARRWVNRAGVDFSSVQTLDHADLAMHVKSGRTRLLVLSLAPPAFCKVLRCLLQSSDITGRQAKWIADAAASLGCP